MSENPVRLGICKLHQLYLGKELSPVEVTRAALEAAGENKHINAFVHLMADSALKAAEASQRRYLKGEALSVMDGVPYGAKDLIYTKDAPTTMASALYRNFIPDYNASVIDRLHSAGAVLLGKTNTQEFACGPTADLSCFGPCRNPHNPAVMATGSSSGSAAALAAGIVPAALGSDTGGSVRIPAASCGIVGIRPGHGLVSRYGVYPLSPTIDSVGPMTCSVRDSAAMLSVLAGYDEKDGQSLPLPIEDYLAATERSAEGMKVGVLSRYFEEPIDAEVRALGLEALKAIESLGAELHYIDSPDPDGSYTGWCRVLRSSEAYAVHYDNLHKCPELYNPEIVQQLEEGKPHSARDYIVSLQKQQEFLSRFTQLLQGLDAVVLPTTPIPAQPLFARQVELDGRQQSVSAMLTNNTILASYSGLPAMSLPMGFCSGRRPAGLQIIAKRGCESRIYTLAASLEKALAEKTRY